MITNLGKNVMAKYLIGQAPAYASHIAVGCGAKPLRALSFSITSVTKISSAGGFLVTATIFTSQSLGIEPPGLYPGLKVNIDIGNANFDPPGPVEIISTPTPDSFTYLMATGFEGSLSNLASSTGVVDFEHLSSLEFEMFRVPIISRGYIKEDGQTKIVFTAEMPTQERYEITELGLYSAGSNPSATGFDSRTLFTFSRQESWKTAEIVGGTELQSDLYIIDSPLSTDLATGDMDPIDSVSADGTDHKAFQTNATNRIFSDQDRRLRSEQLRYLNNMVMLRGNFSALTTGLDIDPESSHIFLPTSVNLKDNSSIDTVKVSFSVVNVINSDPDPGKAKILLRFEDSSGRSAQAVYETAVNQDWSNRYVVVEKPLEEFVLDTGFLWSQVAIVKIYGVVLSAGSISEKYYIALDAIRIENLTSQNPLYGMTAYSVLVTDDQLPIVKLPNTSSLIEFRLGVGI